MERKHLEELRNINLEMADILIDTTGTTSLQDALLDFGVIMDEETAEAFLEEVHSEVCEFVLKFVNVRLKETDEDKERMLWDYLKGVLERKKASIADWTKSMETFKDEPEVVYHMIEKGGKDLGILEHIFKTGIMDYEEAESYLYDIIASEDYKREGFPFTVGQLQMLYNYCKHKIKQSGK